MRKYTKLSLVIITAFSVICFLFYKIQYDKLYNVLQVLEFFGTADQSGGQQILDHRILTGLLPTWQYVSPNLFIYSAFCVGAPSGECVKVTALAAATEAASTSSDIGCQLWYEGTVRPVTGIFASSGLLHEDGHGSNQLKPYVFTCESKFPSMVPFGISITLGRMDGFIHVTTIKQQSNNKKKKSEMKDMVACVGPQQSHVDSTELLTEQVLLQEFYQVSNFVVYDAGLTNRFVSTVSAKQQAADKSSSSSQLDISVLPWNSPPGLDKAASRVLAKLDCHYRAKPAYRSNVFLDIGQVLVMRTARENFLENVFKRLTSDVVDGGGGGAKLDVGVRHFCSESPLDAASPAVEYAIDAIRKTRYDSSLDGSVSVMYNVTPDSDVIKVSEEDLLVHDYGPCENYDMDDTTNEKVDEFLVNHAKQIQAKLGQYFSKIE